MSSVQRIGRGPVGFPFSTITVAGGTFHVSGQVAQDPSTGRIESPQCYEQSLVLLKKLCGMLEEAGFSPEQVAKMTVFLTDMTVRKDFDRALQEQFAEKDIPFACTYVGVKALPNPAAVVEVELLGICPRL